MTNKPTPYLVLALALGVGCPAPDRTTVPTARRDVRRAAGTPARARPAPRPQARRPAPPATFEALLARLRSGRFQASDCKGLAQRFASRAQRAGKNRDAVARARFNEGVAWAHCGLLKRALMAYQAALSARRRYLPALINVGALHLRRGEEKKAYPALLGAFFAEPLHLDANYNLGVLFYRKARKGQPPSELLVRYWSRKGITIGDSYQLALAHLRTVLAKSSARRDLKQATLNLKSKVLVALIYLDSARGAGARSLLMQARLVLTSAARVLTLPLVRGRFCKKGARATAFDTAVAQLHNAQALMQLRRKDTVRAMERFDRALRCDARFVPAMLNRGSLALRARSYWLAYDSYLDAVKQQPRNVEALVGLGIACRAVATAPHESGRPKRKAERWYSRAITSYEQALKVQPDAGDAMFNLAHLYMDSLNNIDLAERWYRKYLALPVAKTRATGRRKASTALKELAYQRRVLKQIQEMQRRARERARRAAARRPARIPPPGRLAGSLKRIEIVRVIRKHLGEIKYCYQQALASMPNLKGTVTVFFTIRTSGKVSKAALASSTLGHRPTESCIIKAVRLWVFPKPKAFTAVTYPFHLKP